MTISPPQTDENSFLSRRIETMERIGHIRLHARKPEPHLNANESPIALMTAADLALTKHQFGEKR